MNTETMFSSKTCEWETPIVMTQFFKVFNSLSARHKYGLPATVHRADGMIATTYALLGGT